MYSFKFNKKRIVFDLQPTNGRDDFWLKTDSLWDYVKKCGDYTDDEIQSIGQIPLGTLINMVKEIQSK